MKIAVIGLGAVGSQVLWQLSKIPGVDAHGFDTHYPGHPGAGVGGDNRLFWNLELTNPEYAPLIVRAGELWQELESESHSTLIDRTGLLIFGKQNAPQVDGAIRSADQTGATIDLLGHKELTERFPQFSFDTNVSGIWDTNGGIIRPELAVARAARAAKARGAIVHEFTRVEHVQLIDGGVELVVNGETIVFDRVVVAAGGWTPSLLPYLRDEVVVRRLTSSWFFAEDAKYLNHLPPFLQTAPNYCYGIPSTDQRTVKLGLGFNDHTPVVNPDDIRRDLSGDELQDQIDRFSWVLSDLLPGLASRPFRVNTYFESYTRSMFEYVRPHPETDRMVVLTGFSGHGFRVAPAIGEVGAELAVHGKSRIDTGFLDRAEPVFDIIDQERGLTTHNSVMSST